MKSVFDDLKGLIDCIRSTYTEVTSEWMRRADEKPNLKRMQVADINVNGIIYRNIMEYVQLLNEREPDISFQFTSVCSCQVSSRVKAHNSIEAKIQKYKTDRHEFGKVSVNKCINDLFGV